MPIGTCDPASRGEAANSFELQRRVHDGVVTVWGTYGWDGVSTFDTGCDGPIESLNVSNTGSASAYALLPNKRKGDKWVEIPAGTNTAIGAGQRTQLGVEVYADVKGLRVEAQPGDSVAAPTPVAPTPTTVENPTPGPAPTG